MKSYSLLILILVSLSAGAQYKLPEDIPTPNASDLGKYGEIPVSYYTGKADISIPLYSLTEHGVTLPVTLQYDASGVLMNSLPGWTGHNWLLSAGGAITRKMNYRCDEYVYPSHVNLAYPTRNYFQSYGSLPAIMAGDDSNYSNLKDSVTYGHNDFAPDIFYFNMMGISGRFFLGNDGQWKVYCDRNIEVIFDINNSSNYIYPFISHYPKLEGTTSYYYQPKTIRGFILRDENGTEYHFGGNTSYIEYFTYLFRSGDNEREASWLANSWYLAKVKDRFGNELYTFTYERGKFIAQFYDACEDILVNHQDPGWSGGMYTVCNKNFPYNAQLLSPVYLKKIVTLSGSQNLIFSSSDTNIPMNSVYSSLSNMGYLSNYYLKTHVPSGTCLYRPFYYLQTDDNDVTPYQYSGYGTSSKLDFPLESTCLRKLNTITLITSAGSRNYSFEYTLPRLFMTKIKIMDDRIHYAQTQAKIAEYRFKYNHLDSLPSDYLTKATDHWGYYNGNPYSIPMTTTEKWQFYNQRNPDGNKSLLGMLSEIIYPTGGKSTFEFEPNDFSSYLNATRTLMIDSTGLAGGVRIKSIKEYDDTLGTTLLRSREFSYIFPYNSMSSGELFAKPRYYWDNWTVWHGNAYVSQQFFRTTSILPLANSFGPHYGYTYVTETDGDKVTEYHFTNISNSMDEQCIPIFSASIGTPYDEFSERGYKKGKLLEVEKRKNQTREETTTYSYRTDNVESKYVLTANLAFENLAPSGAYATYNGGVYKLFYPRYDIVEETRYEKYADPLPQHKTYIYEDKTLTTNYGGFTHSTDVRCLRYETNSVGQQDIEVDYLYTFDSASSDDRSLATDKFLLLPQEATTYYNHLIINRKKTVFAWASGIYLPAYETETSPGGSATDTIVSYLSYNPQGLPTSYQRQGEPVTSLVWDNSGSNILAVIKGAAQPPSLPFNSNTTQQQMIDYFNNYRATSTAQVTSYTYNMNSLLTSVTTPIGYTTYYYYDLFNRLSDVKDQDGNTIIHYDYHYRSNQ